MTTSTVERSDGAGELLPAALQRLGETAVRLAGQPGIRGLFAELERALRALPGAAAWGLGVLDDERGLLGWQIAPPPAGRESSRSNVLDLREPPGCPDLQREQALVDLRVIRSTPAHDRMLDAGARQCVATRVAVENRVLGVVWAGFRDGSPPAPPTLAFLASLARVTASALWGCVAQERNDRNDLARDALAALAAAINTDPHVDAMLRAAGRVLRGLMDSGGGSIHIFDEAAQQMKVYPLDADWSGEAPPAPRIDPVAGTPLAELLRHPTTYQSPDLRSERRWPADDALAANGVRRYVLTPLLAGGRALGGLLLATRDPHAPSRVDIWLFENLALQLALALDNAMLREQVWRVSERLRERVDAPAEVASRSPDADVGAPAATTLREVEAEHIRRVLHQTRGVIDGPRGAARILGLKPSTLRFRMKRLGVRRQSAPHSP